MRKEYKTATEFYEEIRNMLEKIGEVYRGEVERSVDPSVNLYNLIVMPKWVNNIEGKDNVFGAELGFGFITNIAENDINIINPIALLSISLNRETPTTMTYTHTFEVLNENPITEKAMEKITSIIGGYDSHTYTYTVDYVDFVSMLDLETFNTKLALPYTDKLEKIVKPTIDIWDEAQKELDKTKIKKKTSKKKQTTK